MDLNAKIARAEDAPCAAIGYRPDIDGLRAVAVVCVIVFHLSRSTLPGGYLGVDMFFVLSGFLIASIIWREAEKGTFSIVGFYDRRIKRIMPALLLLLLFTSVFAYLILLPADLVGYAKSLLATLAFSANFYFWRDASYFARMAQEKPLLHLWSLGVEEQFYVLFPLLLILLARRWPRAALPCIVALTIISVLLNPLVYKLGIEGAAFWLLPTRAWELGAGAVLALLPSQFVPSRKMGARIGFFGAFLAIAAIVHPFTALSPLPVALPVVAGTALVIFAGLTNASPVNRALAARPFVLVGLISYSLYLWHWPIIVFGQYYLVRDFTLPEKFAAAVLTAAAAASSWRFVERPFRRKHMPVRTSRIAAASGGIAFAAFALALLALQGAPGRLNREAAVINEAVGTLYRCPISDYMLLGSARVCPVTPGLTNPADADVVLLGNSHALMFAPIWGEIFSVRGLSVVLILMERCLPTTLANISLDCNETARSKLSEILPLERAKIVVVGMTWWNNDQLLSADGRRLDDQEARALTQAIDDLIRQLQRSGKQVIVTGPLAQPNWDVASIVSRQLAFGHPVDRPTFLPLAEFNQRFGQAIRHFEERTDIGFARPDLVQCSTDRCNFILDGHSLFADYHHVAKAELWRFRTPFEHALDAIRLPPKRTKLEAP